MPRLGLVCVYSGLALLLLAWWWYGRLVKRVPDRTGTTLALWVAPLLLAPPMFSRDVYSYLAQGLMIHAGMDVYRHGPALLGGAVRVLARSAGVNPAAATWPAVLNLLVLIHLIGARTTTP